MSTITEAAPRRARPALGTFERYLTLWVALCIVVGVVLGRLLPAPFHMLGRMTVAEVNIPVAVLIWLMIVPMLRDGQHQLARQTLQHGRARMVVHRLAVPALPAGRAD